MTSRNVWSRSARRQALRRNKREEDSEAPNTASTIEHNSVGEAQALVVRVAIGLDNEVHLRWLRGRDSILFESFGGWLKRLVPQPTRVGNAL
jgi:hypothetical protein